MTSKDFDPDTARRPFTGFQEYADGRPRHADGYAAPGFGPAHDDPYDPRGPQDWDEADEDGFAMDHRGDGAWDRPWPDEATDAADPRADRPRRAALLGGGVLLLALAGAAVGWSQLSGSHRLTPAAGLAGTPTQSRLAPAAAPRGVAIELAQGQAAANGTAGNLAAAPRMDTLRAEPALAPAGPSPLALPQPQPRALAPPVRLAAETAPAPLARYAPYADAPRDAAPYAPPAARPEPMPSSRALPAFAAARLPGPLDCARVRTPGEAVVCSDPGLVAADRRMARAYAEALASGAPRQTLWRGQLGWLNMREDASRYSRQAVEDIYHDRIDELEALASAADDPPSP
jgi:uncharacterized protein YecT (DUF1311 family)